MILRPSNTLNRTFTRVLIGLTVILISMTLPIGCGKKGPPKLPDAKAPSGVNDLKATLEGDEVILTWTGFGAAGYYVYRSAESADETPCEGCPVLFKRVGQVPMAGEPAAPQRMAYREARIPATRYRFKVVPYDGQGQLAGDSNIVGLASD